MPKKKRRDISGKLFGIILIVIGVTGIANRIVNTYLLEKHSYLINTSPFVENVPFYRISNIVLDTWTGIEVFIDSMLIFIGILSLSGNLVPVIDAIFPDK